MIRSQCVIFVKSFLCDIVKIPKLVYKPSVSKESKKQKSNIAEARAWFRAMILGSGIFIGLAVGLGFYTFYYAKGASYLSNDPKACANCHIMQEHYSAWTKASHRSVATCNDCHTPKGFIPKYLSKASNGFFHSLAFTTGNFHEPIQIKKHNFEIAENACRKCHSSITHAIEANKPKDKLSCTHCHKTVGHDT